MNEPGHNNLAIRYWSICGLICLLQILIIWYSISFVHSAQIKEISTKTETYISFLQDLIQEKLQEKNYSSAAALVQSWGRQQSDYISSISLTMANGFLLGDYHSKETTTFQKRFTRTIPYSYDGSAKLVIAVDLSRVHNHTRNLEYLFGSSAALFCLLLIFLTQLLIRKNRLALELARHSQELTESVTELKKEVAARQKAEAALTESEEKYRSLMNHQSDAIILHQFEDDGFATFTEVNHRATELYGYGYEQMLEMRIPDIICEEDLKRYLAEGRKEELRRVGRTFIETRHVKKSGEIFPAEVHSAVIPWNSKDYILSSIRDITERKRMQERQVQLEQQMLHAQKLESLGVLAGGIAHDFNNILMVILGHGDLAQMKLTHESPAFEHLVQIKQAARKAADLANQMLAYSGKGKFLAEPLDLGHLIREMEYMLSVSISKKAVLRYELNNNLPTIEADPTQIQQIIMNLVINASDAIGDKSGIIAISTGYMDCDRSYLSETWLDENLAEGYYVYIEVADTGCGMSKETISRIFDPFFTTKFTGRGLGMSSVIGIVRGHRGAIKIYSEPDQGTTIKVLFPASGKLSPSVSELDLGDQLTLDGKVLLVDDEETMRSLGKSMLELFGLEVITAENGREAVSIYERLQDEILFVLMDLTMPHMDGGEAFREMRRSNPAVKVILSSGYNEQEISQKFIGKGLSAFLQKPFQIATLQATIQKVLKSG